MKKITFGTHTISCHTEETVLDALLRENIEIPYGCRQGACQSCIVRSSDVTPPPAAQKGLKDTLKKRNHFLACICRPEQDMAIALPDQSDFYTEGTVVDKQLLNSNTVLLKIECKDALEYFAGQFVNLQRADGLTRSYSIANIPQESRALELHIRRLPGGQFSEWVYSALNVGDKIAVSEPQGHCFYLPDRSDQGILLVGTGSGLAPLAGILSDALAQDHSGPIHLFHGSHTADDLYKIEDMRRLERQYDNFHYTPCVSGDDVPPGFTSGRASDVALAAIPSLKGWRAFLCGHPDMIKQMQPSVFLKGAAMNDIYTDAFHLSTC